MIVIHVWYVHETEKLPFNLMNVNNTERSHNLVTITSFEKVKAVIIMFHNNLSSILYQPFLLGF